MEIHGIARHNTKLTEAHGRKLPDEGCVSQLAEYLETMDKDAEAVQSSLKPPGRASGDFSTGSSK